MQRTYAKNQGFTIVELLIVIVVIGILAAISIVAYNSVQEKARLATAQNDMANLKKKLMAYQVENGQYPQSTGSLVAAGLRVTGGVYGGVPWHANLVYCKNTDTDEFAIIARLVNGQATVQVSSIGGVEVSSLMPTYANACAPVGAAAGNRYVAGALSSDGIWASWLAH